MSSPESVTQRREDARALAEGLAGIDGIAIDRKKIVTNIVIFDVTATGKKSIDVVSSLKCSGILAIGFGSLIRMVTHLDIAADDIARTISQLKALFGSGR